MRGDADEAALREAIALSLAQARAEYVGSLSGFISRDQEDAFLAGGVEAVEAADRAAVEAATRASIGTLASGLLTDWQAKWETVWGKQPPSSRDPVREAAGLQAVNDVRASIGRGEFSVTGSPSGLPVRTGIVRDPKAKEVSLEFTHREETLFSPATDLLTIRIPARRGSGPGAGGQTASGQAASRPGVEETRPRRHNQDMMSAVDIELVQQRDSVTSPVVIQALAKDGIEVYDRRGPDNQCLFDSLVYSLMRGAPQKDVEVEARKLRASFAAEVGAEAGAGMVSFANHRELLARLLANQFNRPVSIRQYVTNPDLYVEDGAKTRAIRAAIQANGRWSDHMEDWLIFTDRDENGQPVKPLVESEPAEGRPDAWPAGQAGEPVNVMLWHRDNHYSALLKA